MITATDGCVQRLLSAEGIPKLADFNVGFSDSQEQAGTAASLGGALGYMSPEHLSAIIHIRFGTSRIRQEIQIEPRRTQLSRRRNSNQLVELTLSDNGQFNWTATKSGARSTFSGTYQFDGGQLTLVRAKDQLEMSGTWTAYEIGFTFKLDGESTGGLAFTR